MSQFIASASSTSLLTPIKINLVLHVVGYDAPYHKLDSLICFLKKGDLLSLCVKPNPSAQASLTIKGLYADALQSVCPVAHNLIMKAFKFFSENAQKKHGFSGQFNFTLTKNLPIASGIGGGSSNAAGALKLLYDHAPHHVPRDDLYRIAVKIGADVPMCLDYLFHHDTFHKNFHLSAAYGLRAQNIGDMLSVHPLPRLWVVLINPLKQISTAQIFKALQSKTQAGMDFSLHPFKKDAADTSHRFLQWLTTYSNHLEKPALALCPDIQICLDALKAQKSCKLSRMSGSGATCFGLFTEEKDARLAASNLKEAFPEQWITYGSMS